MAPRARPRARSAAQRVYHSSPAPTQVRFPARRTTVKAEAASAPSSSRALRQQTLTQIVDGGGGGGGGSSDEDSPRPQKRRRTTRSGSGGGEGGPSSSFHTQTLTQLLVKREEEDESDERDEVLVGDSEDEDEQPLGGAAPPSPRGTSTRASSVVPQTPRRRRRRRPTTHEIPSSSCSSSQLPTPAPARCVLSPIRSPLKERSTNVDAPVPAPADMTTSKRPRRLVVQDSYSPAAASLSPAAPSARRRRASLEIPDSDDDLSSLGGPSPAKTSTPAARGPPRRDGDEAATPMRRGLDRTTTTTRTPSGSRAREPSPVNESQSQEEEEEVLEPGTPTPVARRVRWEPRAARDTPSRATPPRAALRRPSTSPAAATTAQENESTTPVLGSQNGGGDGGDGGGLESQRVPLAAIRAMDPPTDRTDIILSIHPGPMEMIARGAKTHEFRRYRIPVVVSRMWLYVTHPVCELRYMATVGPARRPGEIDDGEGAGVGNAAFNAGRMGDGMFAYELRQVYRLNNPVPLATMRENGWVAGAPPQRYVYVPPAVVGQLLGNLRCALFAEGAAEAGGGGGGGGAVEGGEEEEEEEEEAPLSVSQELEEQIRSDMLHSTQRHPGGGGEDEEDDEEAMAAKEEEKWRDSTSPRGRASFAKPSVPRGGEGPVALPRAPATPSRRRATAGAAQAWRPSQATTASEPSSPVVEPRSPAGAGGGAAAATTPRRPALYTGSSLPDWSGVAAMGAEEDEGSPGEAMAALGREFTLGSSSQVLLPESLLVDDARPPPVVLDSDDEGSVG